MLRIRFHGRGGQGMKTASRILGTALFLEGYEVQDAPRYAAERRGAPIFAYVRAARRPIHERGVIERPDLVVVADESLVPLPAAGILAGVDAATTLLIATAVSADEWRRRLNFSGRLLVVPEFGGERPGDAPLVGVACAGAAACLLGIEIASLKAVLLQELADLDAAALARNLEKARDGYAGMAGVAATIREREEAPTRPAAPAWVTLPFEEASVSAPVVHAVANSVQVRTGLWRVLRPVIDDNRCHGCWWVCSSLCPDGVIAVEGDRPRVDYEHCKGCMVCVAVCPHHAIEAVPERNFGAAEVAP